MCVNYAPLNAVTADAVYPINDCLSVLASLGNASVYTSLDIKAGYHNIPLSDGDKAYTVFVT